MARIRFQMFLDEEQKEDLEILRKDSNIAIAEIIRRAIDNYISRIQEDNKITTEELAMERLLSVAGTCEGIPKDLQIIMINTYTGYPKNEQSIF